MLGVTKSSIAFLREQNYTAYGNLDAHKGQNDLVMAYHSWWLKKTISCSKRHLMKI
ncbi:hypothetical protein SAMN05216516_102387 [Izhakiella capsodis]|uniref:Uncharacterized protein n=1 Tax=Izhakiella capsodis TaxID=1367852 RepID=A0A1I4WC51_9GAMM|nr:hypothetical protein SAMN05216516_102387 [Izhakiella capsodis]